MNVHLAEGRPSYHTLYRTLNRKHPVHQSASSEQEGLKIAHTHTWSQADKQEQEGCGDRAPARALITHTQRNPDLYTQSNSRKAFL